MDPSLTAPTAPLLEGFAPVTYGDWKSLVEGELKGAPFEKKMFAATYEGITLRPLYTRADGEKVPHRGSLPGFAPFVRGSRAAGYWDCPWEVSQEITSESPSGFNDAAQTYLQRGLTALNMVLDRAGRNGADPDGAPAADVGSGGLSVASLADLDRALQGVNLEKVPLFIRSGASGMPFAALLVALARKRGLDPEKLRGCIEIDPLGVLAHEGRLPQPLPSAYREMAALTAWAITRAPELQTICIHSRAWHEAGGNAVQELAFALATGLDYLRAMQDRGLEVSLTAPRIRFAYTVGCQFFTEIAKLRAARLLWSRLVSVLGGSEDAQRARLHVRTSLWNKTVFDPHVNLLRATVEAFAGVLGGCDSMQVGAFDEIVRAPDEFSERIARNTQLVLQKECQLDRVIDPAGGSWYVETLTHELAERAWTLFQEIEKRGGMAAAMNQGWPQAEVARIAAEKLNNVARRRDCIIGTNAYANINEKRLESRPGEEGTFYRRRFQQVAAARTEADEGRHREVLDRLSAVVGKADRDLMEAAIEAAQIGATLGEVTRAVRIQDAPGATAPAVNLTRAAVPFEQLRLAVDRQASRMDRRPGVFLANMGPTKQHRARAEFALGFFEVAGFQVLSPTGFKTVEDAVAAAVQSGLEAVCICSTDDTYPDLVPPLVKALRVQKPGVVVILAGYPADQVEAHRAAGVDVFIHMRANALELLTEIATRVGVTV